MCSIVPIPKGILKELSYSYAELVPIASGGFGIVFSAMSLKTGKYVALKVLPLETLSLITLFRNEVKIHNKLKHKNICPLQYVQLIQEPTELYECHKELSIGITSGEYFGVVEMEKLCTDLLNYVLEDPKLSPFTIKVILKGIAEGIDYCHSQGIVHLDIKPENVLLSFYGKYVLDVKLCDFGCAKICDNKEEFSATFVPEFGTLHYLPPECVCKINEDDPVHFSQLDKVDVYGLGVIMFILATSKFPKTYDENCMVVKFCGIEMARPYLSAEGFELMSKMMKDDPSERPTIREVIEHPYFSTFK